MKRLLVVLMICGLILTVSVGAFGKSYRNNRLWAGIWGGDLSQFEFNNSQLHFYLPSYGDWYYIGKKDPNALVCLTTDSDAMMMLGGLYYQNDQTFAEYFLDLANETYDQTNYFKGSYKLENGIFFGFMYFNNVDDRNSLNITSLGYSYSLKKDGYIALNADYASSDGDIFGDGKTQGFLGYALDFIYHTDKARFYGQLYDSRDEFNSPYYENIHGYGYLDESLYYQLGCAYQAADSLAVGLDVLGSEESAVYAVGGTYNFNKGEINARYICSDNDGGDISATQLMAMFNLDDNLKIGPMYTNVDGEAYASLYGIYTLKNGAEIRAAYDFPNEDYDIPSAFTLLYKFNLK